MSADSMEFPVYQPFTSDWIAFGVFFVGIMLVIGIAEYTRTKMQWSAEASRKIVHVLVGVMIFWARFLFESPVPAILIALVFIFVNLAALIKGGFEGMHATDRQSMGTVFYPLSFLILVLMFWYRDPAILLISFLILALTDPLAAQVGENVKNPRAFVVWRDTKSLQGSTALGLAAFFITVVGLFFLRQIDGHPMPGFQTLFIAGISVGVLSAFAESISWGGSDNLSLPLSAALTLDILLGTSLLTQWMFLAWVFVAFVMAFGAYKLEVLNLSGTVAAFLLGSFVFGIGGIQWMIPMGTFFVLSSILSKLGKQKKHILKTVYEKSSNRDMMQVLANGGVAGLLAICWQYTGAEICYYAFLGSLAAATADTWGTELGVFSRQVPRSILNFKRVTMGTSGGITTVGTTGAAAGAALLTLVGWSIPIGDIEAFFPGKIFLIITIAGILGAMFDSLLGATIQAQYHCPSCEKITEKTEHCGNTSLQLHRGYRWINNDVVNFACTATGAVLVLIYFTLI